MEMTTSFHKGGVERSKVEYCKERMSLFSSWKCLLTEMIDIQVFMEPIISYEMCLKRCQCAQMSRGESK